MANTHDKSTSAIPEIAQELADIGEEFGCARDAADTNEDYGERIDAYLENMIEELLTLQDRVRELVG